ncbi:hypothetical protein ABBQ32_008668 [Trebouxia sp. C0010 RCD-2024]
MALDNDLLKRIKATGDSKAGFYVPSAVEAVAGIWTGHFAKTDSIFVRVQLAGTELRDTLDNSIGEDSDLSDRRLHVVIKLVRSAVNAYVHKVLKAADKAAAPKPIHPIGQLGPAFPSQEPKLPHGYYPSHPMQYGHHRAPPPSGPELCRGFAKGACKFGNTCRFIHEQAVLDRSRRSLTVGESPQLTAQQHWQAVQGTIDPR